MKRVHGLTLIEIAIAVVAVALLFAVGLPAYQDRLTRQIVAEAVELAVPAKETVQEFANLNRRLPATDEIALPFVTSRYVSTTAWTGRGASGTVTVLMRSDPAAAQSGLDAKAVTLTATYNAAAGRVEWMCGGNRATTVPGEYLPDDCRPA